jgi:putative ABC transport system permease protein
MRDRDAELREELDAHVRMAADDRIARGEDRAGAIARARRELGNISQIQEATRDVRGGRWLEDAGQDLRYALRLLRHSPGFTLVAVASLTLGIGANTALFQMVDAVRLRPLPVHDPAALVEVRLTDMDGARGNFATWHPAVTYPIWQAIASRQQAFTGVFAWGADSFNLSVGGEARLARGLWVTGDLFSVLGVRPAAGRLLTPADDQPGCAPRAVLSYAFWQRAYGGDRSAVGRTLTLGSHPVEIVGVAESSFFGLEVGKAFDIAVPACADAVFSDDGKGRLQSGTDWWLSVFGRLKPGWTADRATAHLAAISPELFKTTLPPAYPSVSVPKYLKFTLAAFPAAGGLSELRETYTTPLAFLLGISGLVLLIACANLANLLLARATARRREIAVRLGLGASRGRLVRQLLTECILLAAVGGACATLFADAFSGSFVALLDTSNKPTALAVALDWRVLAFTAAVSLATCVVFGLAPALNATRLSPTSVMRANARGATSGREVVGLRRILVVAQVALSVVLLFGSLLFARSLRNLVTMDPGFRAEGVLSASVNFRALDLPPERRGAFRQELADRVRAIPGVQAAAVARIVPVSGDAFGSVVWPAEDPAGQFDALFNWVGTDYFAALQTPVVAGRTFNATDTSQSLPVAIVNEAFAAKLAHDGKPVVGRSFTREATPRSPAKTFEIVGKVRNSTYSDLKEGNVAVAFLADAQDNGGAYTRLVIRASLPPSQVTSAITAAFADMDRRIGLSYGVMTTQIRDSVIRERLLATLSAGFGVLAAVLTLVGLYGLLAYTVTRRSNEIGVRLALGATGAEIARLILRETGILFGIGAGIGLLLALAGGQAAAALLFDVRPDDPALLVVTVALLACIAMLATLAPTLRAMRIEAANALRME